MPRVMLAMTKTRKVILATTKTKTDKCPLLRNWNVIVRCGELGARPP